MSNEAISSLVAVSTLVGGDLFEVVDITNLTMGSTGTNSKLTFTNLVSNIQAAAFTFTPNEVAYANGSGILTGSAGLTYNGTTLQTGTLEVTSNIYFKNPTGSTLINMAAPSGLPGNYQMILPSSIGTSGQVLATDGAGHCSWVNQNVTPGTIVGPGSSTNFAIPLWNGTSGTVLQNSSLIYSSYTLSGLNAIDINGASPATNGYAIAGQIILGTTGSGNNLLVGYASGISLNVVGGGVDNTTCGYFAGQALTIGARNVAIGYEAGQNMTTDVDNVMIGWQAGHLSAGTGQNVFIGSAAGQNNTASGNIYIGNAAGVACTTGAGNVAIGIGAGGSIINNATCVIVGYGADVTGGWSDSIALGYDTLITTSNQFAVGSATSGRGMTLVSSATSGSASSLPVTPATYWTVHINGTDYKIPLYNM